MPSLPFLAYASRLVVALKAVQYVHTSPAYPNIYPVVSESLLPFYRISRRDGNLPIKRPIRGDDDGGVLVSVLYKTCRGSAGEIGPEIASSAASSTPYSASDLVASVFRPYPFIAYNAVNVR
ncbi:hypothetical protein MRX96_050182 [Rhipicephalus microplus]